MVSPGNQKKWGTSIWSIEPGNTRLQNLVRVQDEHRAHAGFELHLSSTQLEMHNLTSFSGNYQFQMSTHLGMKLGGPWIPMWQVVYSTSHVIMLGSWTIRSDPPGGRERPPSSVAETKERLRRDFCSWAWAPTKWGPPKPIPNLYDPTLPLGPGRISPDRAHPTTETAHIVPSCHLDQFLRPAAWM